MNRKLIGLFSSTAFLTVMSEHCNAGPDAVRTGLDVKKTGLIPRYPTGLTCPTVTSFYGSWNDVDGSKRDEPHSGIDAGGLGNQIRAPGPGVVVAAWRANWGWGQEGAILIRHRREDLGLPNGPRFYYSEFDHLRYDEVLAVGEGTSVNRGESLATVFRPGGRSRYLPEVHWEVWQVEDDDAIEWRHNKFGGRYWTNPTGRLVDPLYMLSLNDPASEDGSVDLPLFRRDKNYVGFRGFTYIFSCRKADPE
jgi:murein DD-endopeptidase MepM/ murein hydrolase activator NlpD